MTEEIKKKVEAERRRMLSQTPLLLQLPGPFFTSGAHFALSLCQQQMQEKDKEIERLNGLIEEAFQEHPIKRNWQQFKTDNKL